MGFSVTSVGKYVMDLVFPPDYNGSENFPGCCITYSKGVLLGVILAEVEGPKVVSLVEHGVNPSVMSLKKRRVKDELKHLPVGDFLCENNEMSVDTKLKEKGSDVNCVCAKLNKRSSLLNDSLLGYVHALSSMKDTGRLKLLGKVIGFTIDNEVLKPTCSSYKLSCSLIKSYANRMVVTGYKRRGPVKYKSKDPKDVVSSSGIKEFCMFKYFNH